MLSKFWRNISLLVGQNGESLATGPWIVGLSGGADSQCLLHGLHSAGVPVVAAHFNHHLRQQADADQAACAALAERLGVPFTAGQGDVAAEARGSGQSTEAAGRALRYAFLFEQARQRGASAVAVAHTADDQAETVLLHLLRGSGSAGLQGMAQVWLPNAWSETIPLLRPLLDCWKSEILTYCEQNGLQPVLDASNLDTAYTRNRLRAELLPLLETYNPEVRPALLRLAEVVRAEQDILQLMAEQAWQTTLRREGEGYLCLAATGVAHHLAVQRLLVRRVVRELRPGLEELNFETIERLAGWLADETWRGPADLVGGLQAWREGGAFWLAGWEADLPALDWPQLPEAGGGMVELALPVPGRLELANGWRAECRLLSDAQEALRQALHNADPYQAWLDLDAVGQPLCLRPRWPGALIRPLGLDGRSKKLSDVMVDAHLPRRARRAWPLVCAGSQVLWAPGLAAGHTAQLRPQTRRAAWLRLWRGGE